MRPPLTVDISVIALLAPMLALGFVFAIGLDTYALPAAAASVGAFSLSQAFLPRARLRSPVLSPMNWIIGVFSLQLVVTPLTILLWGPANGVLRSMPSQSSISLGLLISSAAYLAFCLGAQAFSPRGTHEPGCHALFRSGTEDSQEQPAWRAFRVSFYIFYIGLGVLGYALAFSDADLVAYYTRTYVRLANPSLPATIAGAASTFLRPFLPFALVALWFEERDHGFRGLKSRALGGITVAVSTLVFLSYGYNRSVVVAPLVCMAAASLRHASKKAAVLLAVGVPLAFYILLLFGEYRGQPGASLGELLQSPSARARLAERADSVATIQVYSGGPQFVAFLLDATGWGKDLYWGSTLVSSVLYPVPVLGKPFRPDSGVSIYNRLVYGNSSVIDQMVPAEGEIYMNFGMVGVLLFYCAFGALIARVHARFLAASGSLGRYVPMYFTISLGYLIHGSVAVVSQSFVYFYLPILGYLLAFGAPRRVQLPVKAMGYARRGVVRSA